MNLMKTLTLKNLKLNRKRTIVTIVGIILATALLSALVTLVSSFQYSMIEYQKQKGGDFHVKFSNVKMSELSEFKNNRNIESTFETMGMGFAKLDGCKNEDKPYAYVMATDEAGFERGCFKLIEGRMAKNEDEIVIPRHLKTNGRIDIKVGDEITLDVGKRYDSNTESVISENCAYEHEAETLTDTVTKHYKVVGIMERPGYGMEDYSAAGYTFVTYSDELAAIDNGTKSEASEADTTLTVYSRYTQKALRNKDAVTADIIGVDEKLFEKANNSSVEMSSEESDRFLKEMENAKYDIYMNGYLINYECVFPIDGSFKALFTVAAVVALIIILTSVYCIKNSFNISITEKIRQYGMLASVGATRRQIKSSVKTEAAMLGVIGIPVGTMSGILASLILVNVVNALSAGWLNFALSFHTSLPALILAVILSIATIYFSATGSARRAARVTPLEAIRNTKEIKIKSAKLKTPAIIGRIWGIGGVISYKNIKRNKKKYRTTLEKETEENPEYSQISFYVSNMDKQMRDEKSLFTLLGVFAYGLIVVIALIGITNIINTLSTGMELRSREFATLRSIGMTDKQFAGMVRLESVFISVKALVIGVPLGILISYLLCVMMNRMDDAIIYEPPYKAIILCIVVVIMLIYAIMKLSMTKLRHNNIIETIKNENL